MTWIWVVAGDDIRRTADKECGKSLDRDDEKLKLHGKKFVLLSRRR
jgi:hypothetical protein